MYTVLIWTRRTEDSGILSMRFSRERRRRRRRRRA